MTTRPPIPVLFFGMPVGILGLSGAWAVGERIWDLPTWVSGAIGVLGALVWLVLLVLYTHKWLRYRVLAQQEFGDRVQSSFVSLVFISTMLAAITALQVSRVVGVTIFGIAIVGQLLLGIWLLGRLWQGGQGADFITPALYLPAVGQNFVAANGAAALEWLQIGSWLFGCGAISWVAVESVILARASTRDPMPEGMRSAIGVQLAPPVVGGLAYLSLTAGTPDLLAHMMFGYGLFQGALLLRLWPWIRQRSFSPSYWSFSFGVTALPTMAMRMVERGDSGPMVWAAAILFTVANVVIAYLAVSSVRLLFQGKLVPPPLTHETMPHAVTHAGGS